MQSLFFLLLLFACPIGMIFMMRGGGRILGGGQDAVATAAQERRIVDLEQEVAGLRNAAARLESPELIGAQGRRRP